MSKALWFADHRCMTGNNGWLTYRLPLFFSMCRQAARKRSRHAEEPQPWNPSITEIKATFSCCTLFPLHLLHTVAHCCTLLHTVAHCCTLLHTVAHCSLFTCCTLLLHTVAHCCTLLHIVAHCCTLFPLHLLHTVAHCCTLLSHTVAYCCTLLHTVPSSPVAHCSLFT